MADKKTKSAKTSKKTTVSKAKTASAKSSKAKVKLSLFSKATKTKPKKTKSKKKSKAKLTSTQLLGRWLVVSLVINLALGVLVLLAHSNPLKYTDATGGYTVSIPAGWVRDDTAGGVFRAKKGNSAIYSYGQRGLASNFASLPRSEQDSILDDLVNQTNAGSNQFIGVVSADMKVDSSALTYHAERRPQDKDGNTLVRISFTGEDLSGTAIQGDELLLITKSGGVYNLIAVAPQSQWDSVKADIEEAISSYRGV